MANIWIYPGLFLKVGRDITSIEGGCSIKAGTTVQVLNCRYFLTFVGCSGRYQITNDYMETAHNG